IAWRLSAPARPTSNRVAPSMERAEKIGLGIATAGHVLLFGVLSANFLGTPNPLKLRTPPMDVQFVEKVGLEMADRKSVVAGKRVSVGGDPGGGRNIKKK